MSALDERPTDDDVKEILATPVEELIALALGFLVASDHLFEEFLDPEDVPERLREFCLEVATIADDYLGDSE